MTTPTLFRAVAYRLQRRDTPPEHYQPEVHVFVEAADLPAAQTLLPKLLSLAWGCEPHEVEFYNMASDADLRGQTNCPAGSGDAYLLQNGHYHGPLFAAASRTMMFVRPLTQMRLLQARRLAAGLQSLQRTAVGRAQGLQHGDAAARAVRMRDTHEAVSVSEMGGLT